MIVVELEGKYIVHVKIFSNDGLMSFFLICEPDAAKVDIKDVSFPSYVLLTLIAKVSHKLQGELASANRKQGIQ